MDLFEEMAKSLVCILASADEDHLFETLYGEGYSSEDIESFIAQATE